MMRSAVQAIAVAVIVTLCTPQADGHAIMIQPNQRGALRQWDDMVPPGFAVDVSDVPNYTADWKAHFPAGDKNDKPGSALESQKAAAGAHGWSPYKPFYPNFKWRAGVCGDLLWGREHLRGGKFYNGGKIAATYKKGSVIEIAINMVANHNGFMEFRLCDVQKCGGEINRECFKNGHCPQLKRAWDPVCESGNSPHCGPIDRANPGRWYVPCTTFPLNKPEHLGPSSIKYKLPPELTCEHCVLQWYWVTGNLCNAPGVREYFDGPNKPNWGSCKGQAEAIGGVSRTQRNCARWIFPEEYYQCADIRIHA